MSASRAALQLGTRNRRLALTGFVVLFVVVLAAIAIAARQAQDFGV